MDPTFHNKHDLFATDVTRRSSLNIEHEHLTPLFTRSTRLIYCSRSLEYKPMLQPGSPTWPFGKQDNYPGQGGQVLLGELSRRATSHSESRPDD
jgi:hypothetical protein